MDALRYDFTVPFRPTYPEEQPQHFHNALTTLHETSIREPHNAFLLPFIADPPTSTLQRLKALTTGTLPTFVDLGSNFAGTAIDEDNLIEQLYLAGKKVALLGDDTWESLFPGYFEPNLTHSEYSFDVTDLDSVDNIVNRYLFPLLEPAMSTSWDVVIGHYLGVDHAGHRYGPGHSAMNDKLKQMDDVFRRVIDKLDDRTLLVVMGDHGMDTKGDHGGESDDEVEAALWMYSKRRVFGRSEEAFREPPPTAKQRPVDQIDLVSTLALLLGLPVPFNNLGHPIEEAFVQNKPNFENLAQVSRLTTGQIKQYMGEYAKARTLDDSAMSPIASLWEKASKAWERAAPGSKASIAEWTEAYRALRTYQVENIRACRSLWARFDLLSISMGIVALLGTFVLILLYSQSVLADRADLSPALLLWGAGGTVGGGLIGGVAGMFPGLSFAQLSASGAVFGGVLATLSAFWPARHVMRVPYPTTFWGGLCTLSTVLLCIGFAANSFTIWEDEQLLFILTTFGVLMLVSSLGQDDAVDRNGGALNALSFLVATRLSSLSRLCREEQTSNCFSTYYASATSSTSAGWQLLIPITVAFILPSAIRQVYVGSRNYQGSAVIWIGIALRLGLFLVAIFWVLDAADDGDWYPELSSGTLKTIRVLLAQIILAVAFAAGYGTYVYASPLLHVKEEAAPSGTPTTTSKPIDASSADAPILTTLISTPKPRSRLIILGYANAQGTRYFLLPSIWILALLLVQKPMGQGTLALCLISLLNTLEIIDALNLRRSPLGPTLFALLAHFHFFKTGHQAVLSTIQWETSLIASHRVTYPLSPLLILLNTYGPHILCAIAVPAISLWKVQPKLPGLLGRVAGAMATFLLFYAAIALATVVESAWLRRHLMLYRVFMPRMLLGVTSLLVVEIVAAVVAVGGVRWSLGSVGEVFGWAEQ